MTLEAEQSISGKYLLEKKDIKDRNFAKFVIVKTKNGDKYEPCAYVTYEPSSHILPEDSCHVKIDNKYLYQSDLKAFVEDILNELKLKYKSVSRLDVASDFVKFNRISVPQFYKNVLAKNYLKRYCTSFHVDGKLTRNMPVHYMRFGSKSSGLQWYLYNKSKELREKTDKPYIRENWTNHNLPHKSREIWRIEFVLHPSKDGVVDSETGEAIGFDTLDFLETDFRKRLFSTLFDKHCDFRVNDGQQRKERMKKVELLKLENYQSVYQRITEKSSSNRMHKVHIKWLYQLNQNWRLQNPVIDDKIMFTDLLLAGYIDNHDLTEWYNCNVIENTEHKIKEADNQFSDQYYKWKDKEVKAFEEVKKKHRLKTLENIKKQNNLRTNNQN